MQKPTNNDILYKRIIQLNMKAISLLAILLCCFIKGYGQEQNSEISSESLVCASYITSPQMDAPYVSKDVFDYKQTSEWKKYKTLRTLGWCSLGVGVPVTAFGIWLAIYEYDHYKEATLGATVIAIGGTFTLASIPLFISSSHYKNKAKKLSLNMGVTQIATPTFTATSKNAPALSLALSF